MSANRKEKKVKLDPWVTLTFKDQENEVQPARYVGKEKLVRKEEPG
jgi:hypothetical protein